MESLHGHGENVAAYPYLDFTARGLSQIVMSLLSLYVHSSVVGGNIVACKTRELNSSALHCTYVVENVPLLLH